MSKRLYDWSFRFAVTGIVALVVTMFATWGYIITHP